MIIHTGVPLSCNIKLQKEEPDVANNVFANGLEIACKAADGKSVACFPDVCFTPPPPPAGFIPIPYANTAYAKDTSNASKTVFISGKPVMKKDKSFFKTSTGNEPAAGPLGIVTHVKKGKAFFTSWSMNVKIEGQNVDRHTDLTTHNHGSTANTGPWAYLDSATKKDCVTEIKKMKKACEAKKKKKKKVHGKMKLVDSDEPLPLYKKKSGDWRKHCKGLEILPKELSKEDFEAMKAQAAKKLNSLELVEKALDRMVEQVSDKAIEKIGLMAAKTLAKAGLKGWLGPIGWAWTAYDVYDGIKTANQLRQMIKDIKKEVSDLKNFTKKFSEMNGDEPDKEMAEIMKNIGKFNGCIRARKCQLVKYTSTKGVKKTQVGCCTGQTGHHIIPNSFYFKGSVEEGQKVDDCKKYKEGKAPAVCAEGTGKTHGSHGELHSSFQKHADKDKDGTQIEYKDARNAAIRSHKKVFGLSQCSTKCLKAQLDNYQKKACKGDNPNLTHKQIIKTEKDYE